MLTVLRLKVFTGKFVCPKFTILHFSSKNVRIMYYTHFFLHQSSIVCCTGIKTREHWFWTHRFWTPQKNKSKESVVQDFWRSVYILICTFLCSHTSNSYHGYDHNYVFIIQWNSPVSIIEMPLSFSISMSFNSFCLFRLGLNGPLETFSVMSVRFFELNQYEVSCSRIQQHTPDEKRTRDLPIETPMLEQLS